MVRPGIHRCGRREERAVDDEQVVDVVRAAEGVEHGRTRIGPEHERPALVRRVPRPVRMRHDDRETEPAQDPFRVPHQPPVRAQIVRCVIERDASGRVQRHRVACPTADPRTSPASRRRARPTRRRRRPESTGRPSAPSHHAFCPATGSRRADTSSSDPRGRSR